MSIKRALNKSENISCQSDPNSGESYLRWNMRGQNGAALEF